MRRHCLWSVLPMLLTLAAHAEMSVEVKTDHPNAIYKCGEPIVISARVMDGAEVVTGAKVRYELIGDGGIYQKGEFVSDAGRAFQLRTALPLPGAIRSEFILLDAAGKPIPIAPKRDQWVNVSGRIGAVAEPEKLVASGPRPADFDQYWAKQRKQLDAVPMEPERVLFKEVDGIKIYDVKVRCLGGRPVSGYLAIPAGAKPGSCPIFVNYHGAGVTTSNWRTALSKARQGFIAFDVNAHGVPNGKPGAYYQDLFNGELKAYYYKIYNSLEEHYFRGMILRVMRGLDYVKTLPEWNGRDLIVSGGSQGGYQGLIAAALDPQVSLCRVNVPAFADFYGEFYGTPKRMPRFHLGQALRSAKRGDAFNKRILGDYAYLDPINFAPNIRCKTYITVGFCDLSSPTTAVYAIYNAIPATTKKKLYSYPSGIHSTSNAMPGADER